MLALTPAVPIPTVFVSSVVHGRTRSDPGLAPIRARICDLVERQFRWNCICSGITDADFWGASLSACLSGVERCDLFLCLFWNRTGSIVDWQGVSVTEHELYRAMNLQKPIRVYIVDSPRREATLSAFLSFLTTDPILGQYVRCCSIKQVFARVREDLLKFAEEKAKPDGIRKLKFQPYLPDYLAALRRSSSPIQSLSHAEHQVFDAGVVEANLDLIRALHSTGGHRQILDVGYDTFRMLRLRPPHRYPNWAGPWLTFLRFWFGASSWLGNIEGPFGSIAASRAAMEIARISEDFVAFHAAAGMLGSSVYTLATITAARGRTIREPDLVRQSLLRSNVLTRQALTYNTLTFRRLAANDPNVTSSRASMFLQLGRKTEALELFKLALRQTRDPDDRTRLYSEIGRTLLAENKLQEGIRLVEKSVLEMQPTPISSQIRILRGYAEALVGLKSFGNAQVVAEEALRLAKLHGYTHQQAICESVLTMAEHRKKK